MCPVRRVILIEDSHDRATRRCNLAHALAHVDLSHQATRHGTLTARQELAADRLAARRLIATRTLLDLVAWVESTEELAHELDVDMRMLSVRSRTMHPAERALVLRRLDAKVLTA